MNQGEINKAEWENQKNWHGPSWISVYYSKKDSRVLVPKQIRWMGLGLEKATPNIGNPLGLVFLIAVIVAIFLLGFMLFKLEKG
ncbi:MAG: hypothetical protein K9L86_07365 [Candidatus Omnitrophica bacterium]|nr:hypothetical protein [Candidatus Omnitrophota bacterium]